MTKTASLIAAEAVLVAMSVILEGSVITVGAGAGPSGGGKVFALDLRIFVGD